MWVKHGLLMYERNRRFTGRAVRVALGRGHRRAVANARKGDVLHTGHNSSDEMTQSLTLLKQISSQIVRVTNARYGDMLPYTTMA
jgi:hypothetical protein